ncbi:hypothetical protein JTB14_000965 [Gonioctena quinquepunctata]|nr:hypothetical protein JTB14_000965 [Gonioctena quinquepunctata]
MIVSGDNTYSTITIFSLNKQVGLEDSLDTTKVVEEVLNTISAPGTIYIMKTARLGFPKEGRARTVKVELPDTDMVKCDRTPKQYEELATLYTTLAARKAAGENVAIKYRNNCPEIDTIQNEHLRYPKRSREEEGSPEHNPRKSTKPDHAKHSKNP